LEILDGFDVVFGSGSQEVEEGVGEGLKDGDEDQAEHAREEEEAADELPGGFFLSLGAEVGDCVCVFVCVCISSEFVCMLVSENVEGK
jgi:hypothetical protein